MRKPPTGKTAHVDTFVRDHLPPPESWPDLLYDFPEVDYPPQMNVATELLDVHVNAGRGDRPVLHTEAGPWSYAKLLESANRIAHVLRDDFGVVPGNRVLLRSPNNPMMLACWLAVAKAGGVVVATMPLLRRKELTVIANKARVGLALCDDRLMEEMESAYEACTFVENIATYEGLERLAKDKPAAFDNVDTAVDDPVLIAFTSGTTGAPKGCVHFHRDILASADAFFKTTIPCDENDVFTGSPPLAFTFGFGMHAAFPLRIGASTALIERPSPDAILETCQRYRASVIATAPTAYRAMTPLVSSYDLSSLRHCVSAGETLPLPTFQAWREATGLRIIDGLGTTELFHMFVLSVGDDIRPGATGKPVYGYEAKVFDDDMNECAPGETGRLAVRGVTGCRYLDDPRQTDYVRDGWNFTGDAYKVDEDGYFWFQARADDMIISAGYNISGPEVEEALLTHEAVADCACAASPDPERGFIVKAFVVLNAGHSPGGELVKSLQDFVKQTIAPYKYPRAIDFVDALPRTETGKVQRFKLRQQELERKAGP
jgi:2-aminobenzoate-CoA ligase